MDAEALLELGYEFHAESPYADLPFSEKNLNRNLLAWMQSSDAAVFVAEADDGLVGCSCVAQAEFYFSTARYAMEQFWFVSERHRGGSVGQQMLHRMQDWAASKGCTYFSIIKFHGDVPKPFMPFERTFAVRLN
ncbi:MAG: GNAT family N-acetyltransferase [Myxococcota bacterium]|nr:GNAT family N-acetyltransferase [Myxococcota bacterium]